MTQSQNMLQERSLGDEFSASAISFGGDQPLKLTCQPLKTLIFRPLFII